MAIGYPSVALGYLGSRAGLNVGAVAAIVGDKRRASSLFRNPFRRTTDAGCAESDSASRSHSPTWRS
jgi:hypothetical protein